MRVVTGVHSDQDLAKALLAGAVVTMLVSALLSQGLVTSLSSRSCALVARHRLQSVDRMRRMLSQRAAADPERVGAFECRVRGGSVTLIRAVRPDDKWRLQEGLKWPSPQSRYLRFHAHVEQLTEAQLRYLTGTDRRNHTAWVALDPTRPDRPGVDVGRYMLRNDVLAENTAMLELLDQLGGSGTPEGRGAYRGDVPIPEVPDQPYTPGGRVFEAAAQGRVDVLGALAGGGERGWLREYLEQTFDGEERR